MGVKVVGEGVADDVRDCCLLGPGVGVEADLSVWGAPSARGPVLPEVGAPDRVGIDDELREFFGTFKADGRRGLPYRGEFASFGHVGEFVIAGGGGDAPHHSFSHFCVPCFVYKVAPHVGQFHGVEHDEVAGVCNGNDDLDVAAGLRAFTHPRGQ